MENNKHSNFSTNHRLKLEEDFAFDQAFQNKFNDHEIVPPEQVWGKVSKKLPFNLYIKRQLNWLSKIAAILLIGMLISVLFHKKQEANLIAKASLPDAASTINPTETTTALNPEYVFDLEDKKIVQQHNKRKKRSKEITHSPDLEELWAELLDEEILPEEDQIINSVIGSIESLPILNTIALVPPNPDIQLQLESEITNAIATEIEIRIPLKIESAIRVD